MTTKTMSIEDELFPVYCLLCRTHIPRTVSDRHAGYCHACHQFQFEELLQQSKRMDLGKTDKPALV